MYPAQLESTSLLPRYRPRYILLWTCPTLAYWTVATKRVGVSTRTSSFTRCSNLRGRMTSSYSRGKIYNSFRLRAGQCNEKIQLSCLGQLRTSKQDIYILLRLLASSIRCLLVSWNNQQESYFYLDSSSALYSLVPASKQIEQLERIDKQDSATSQLTQFILYFRLVALLRNLAFEISTYLDSR